MMKDCPHCSNAFERSANSQKYCSASCQTADKNKRSVVYQKQWVKSEKRKNYLKRYRSENQERLRKRDASYRKNTPEQRLRNFIGRVLTERVGIKTVSYKLFVDYSLVQLRNHLEQQFKPGMSWETYSHEGWHIDHIRPMRDFVFFDEDGNPRIDQIKECMSLKNLQPLWAEENYAKRKIELRLVA